MMSGKFRLYLCKTYQLEAEALARRENWQDVKLHYFEQVCGRAQQPTHSANDQQLINFDPEEKNAALIGCAALYQKQKSFQTRGFYCLEQCFHMVVNPPVIDHFMAQGGYVITPGWLADWRQHLSNWGFDRPTAQEFFKETTRKLVLLDTGVDPNARTHLQEFGDYLEQPVEILPVGLDYIQLYFSKIVTEWRQHQNLKKIEALRAEANRTAANYAMAVDLATNLTQIRTEAEAEVEIVDLFTMLFSLGKVTYFPVQSGQLKTKTGFSLSEEERQKLENWALFENSAYAWTPSGNGFYLRLEYMGETLAVLQADDFQLPQYRQQYLSLALMVARLCGLAVTNARIYQKMVQTEQLARHEQEVSDTLRQVLTEMAGEMNLDHTLHTILMALSRVIPYHHAAIYLLHHDILTFKVGLQKSQTNDLLPYIPVEETINIQAAQQETAEGTPAMINRMGVPLTLGNHMIGFLTIGGEESQSYSKEARSLATSFAEQAAVAIENANMFQKIQQMAITDSLTGLYNRRQFFDLSGLEYTRSRRYHRPLALLMMDIDHFKRINDTYGHSVGDQVLVSLANECSQKVRSADIVCRYGGEEFIILMPETNGSNAIAFAERLRGVISQITLPTPNNGIQITVSMGLACLDATCDSLEELVRRSDEALYAAKRNGRNQVVMWEPGWV